MQDFTCINDPDIIEQLASEKESETLNFLKNLKSELRSEQIDLLVHQLYKTIAEKIDCTLCANCCKKLNAAFTETEINRLADSHHVQVKDFINQHLTYNEIEQFGFIKQKPCCFLKNNCCSIYEARPASCSDYPHLDRPYFIFRIKNTMENYKRCPIVYHVVEALKIHSNIHIKV
jgi:Fe-S-cluster containining protein